MASDSVSMGTALALLPAAESRLSRGLGGAGEGVGGGSLRRNLLCFLVLVLMQEAHWNFLGILPEQKNKHTVV